MRYALYPFALAAFFGAVVPAHAQTAQNAQLQYRGPYGVGATMNFKQTGTQYAVNTVFKVPMYRMTFASGGTIQNGVLHTVRFTDSRNGTLYSQAQMNYGNHTIRFGKADEPAQTRPITGPAQDLFALAWQVAIDPGKLSQVRQITNGKGVYPVTRVNTNPSTQSYRLGNRNLTLKVYQAWREGSAVTLAIAPELGNVPVIIKYREGGKDYELRLSSAVIDGKSY